MTPVHWSMFQKHELSVWRGWIWISRRTATGIPSAGRISPARRLPTGQCKSFIYLKMHYCYCYAVQLHSVNWWIYVICHVMYQVFWESHFPDRFIECSWDLKTIGKKMLSLVLVEKSEISCLDIMILINVFGVIVKQ